MIRMIWLITFWVDKKSPQIFSFGDNFSRESSEPQIWTCLVVVVLYKSFLNILHQNGPYFGSVVVCYLTILSGSQFGLNDTRSHTLERQRDCVCVCLCVCVWERERGREREVPPLVFDSLQWTDGLNKLFWSGFCHGAAEVNRDFISLSLSISLSLPLSLSHTHFVLCICLFRGNK